MRVAFTYYPLFIRYNHGAAVLASHCQDAGIETAIIPMGRKWREQMAEYRPDITCFSFITRHDYQMARPFIDATQGPKLAGGVYARKGGKIVGDFLHICRGEGESLPKYLVSGDTSLFEHRLFAENIDRMPDYSGVTGYEFDRGYPFLQGKKMIPYSHSRGCPFKCSFCEIQNLPIKIRVKTTIKRDLEELGRRFAPDLFYFTDELLPYYSGRWRRRFAGNRYQYVCMIRADIPPESLHFLIDNGMYACAFGVESGDERFRNDFLNKGVSDRDIYRTVAILQKHGVNYVPFFMERAPGETEEMRAKTVGMRAALGGYPVTAIYEELGR